MKNEEMIKTPNGMKRWSFVKKAIENHDDLVETLDDVDKYLAALVEMQPNKNRGTEGKRIREAVRTMIAKVTG